MYRFGLVRDAATFLPISDTHLSGLSIEFISILLARFFFCSQFHKQMQIMLKCFGYLFSCSIKLKSWSQGSAFWKLHLAHWIMTFNLYTVVNFNGDKRKLISIDWSAFHAKTLERYFMREIFFSFLLCRSCVRFSL